MPTLFEQSNGTQTPTYAAVIKWWQQLDAASPMVKMSAAGPTDAGYPLHLVLVAADRVFDPAAIKQKRKNNVNLKVNKK